MKESSKNEMIYVLDVYKDWCGPCTVMRFFFDQLMNSEAKVEQRVGFYNVDQELVADQIKEILPRWSNVNIDTKGCCPLFMFIQKGEIVAEVNGCDSPEVMRQIMDFIPPVPVEKREDNSP
eukprot:CAMPEP_0171625914 /NCGR_PEP_ID=MMETSP0990-20121206/19697_1 /TAXON_ID=483369 /ORGANISM="non described non described, Strain CCMP2098" /LENGTH=120 /DNA_ID=CAMNT_0012193143 /DNA_START=198 /DNA_END=560 /DNA_ORIENTATION=+